VLKIRKLYGASEAL